MHNHYGAHMHIPIKTSAIAVGAKGRFELGQNGIVTGGFCSSPPRIRPPLFVVIVSLGYDFNRTGREIIRKPQLGT